MKQVSDIGQDLLTDKQLYGMTNAHFIPSS